MPGEWNAKVFAVNEEGFEALALGIFRFQYQYNPVYAAFAEALGIDPDSVHTPEQIPFLPVHFFKSHDIKTTGFQPHAVFESSGTTGRINSRHQVKDISMYEESFLRGFELFYGPVKQWCILGLLPSYLERKNSSLAYMVDKLIRLSEHPQSGFYNTEYEKLSALLNESENRKQKTLLIGVTFALLDFAEQLSIPLRHTIIMETGGMKGRREEITRQEVHAILKRSFSTDLIHSEYGMTELLSQAYSKGEGVFYCPPWMRVLLRDEEDPLTVKSVSLAAPKESIRAGGQVSESLAIRRNTGSLSESRSPQATARSSPIAAVSGMINIIDLANIYSCSFIATDDIGKLYPDGSFEVLGRMDGSDLRGCSLMVL